MGGGGSNQAAINEQKKAAAEARYKEELRQWRLDKGLAEINNLFDATPLPTLPAMPVNPEAEQPLSYSAWLVKNALLDPQPGSGYDKRWGEMTPPTTNPVFGGSPGTQQQETPDYQSLYQTYLQSFQTPTEDYSITPTTDPWQDTLVNTFLDAHKSYYMPQLEDQFGKAKDNLTFDLARAGLLRSSAAADSQADLLTQKATNEASILSQGDEGAASLKQQINAAKQNAINQLYATENPEIGANAALSSIRTIQQQQPSYSPLGDIFRTAAIGLTNYQSGRNDRRYNNIITGGTNRNAATTVYG